MVVVIVDLIDVGVIVFEVMMVIMGVVEWVVGWKWGHRTSLRLTFKTTALEYYESLSLSLSASCCTDCGLNGVRSPVKLSTITPREKVQSCKLPPRATATEQREGGERMKDGRESRDGVVKLSSFLLFPSFFL